MNALLFGGLRQNLPSSFSLTGMAHKKELSYNLRLLADTPRKATAKSRLLSSSERPYLEDIQEQRLELASYQVAFTNQLHKVLLQAMFLFI